LKAVSSLTPLLAMISLTGVTAKASIVVKPAARSLETVEELTLLILSKSSDTQTPPTNMKTLMNLQRCCPTMFNPSNLQCDVYFALTTINTEHPTTPPPT
jgi:hypothetical protein